MEYMTVQQAGVKWDMTVRRLAALCRSGRIPGVKKNGRQWLIPDDSKKPLDGRTKEYAKAKRKPEPSIIPAAYTEIGAGLRVIEKFRELYGKEPYDTSFVPYHICPVGAHCDHQLGVITGFVIDKGIHIAYGPKQNGIVEISSLQFPKRAQWHVCCTPETKQNDWADHLRGITIELAKRYPLRIGLCAILDGELPIGGISSSAAIMISFLSALARMNGIRLSNEQLIDISHSAEINYLGAAGGYLGQVCEIYSRKNRLLRYDFKSDKAVLVPEPENMPPYDIVLFFSGVSYSLTEQNYFTRVDECRAAAYALMSFSGMEYGKLSEANMRDVPFEIFEQYGKLLPDAWRRRAHHWYSECSRVESAVNAWSSGDIKRFGSLCIESGESTVNYWQTVSPELNDLFKIIVSCEGVYGGRFLGAGFKGCCFAFIDPEKRGSVLSSVKNRFIKLYPELSEKYSSHICSTANGLCLK